MYRYMYLHELRHQWHEQIEEKTTILHHAQMLMHNDDEKISFVYYNLPHAIRLNRLNAFHKFLLRTDVPYIIVTHE